MQFAAPVGRLDCAWGDRGRATVGVASNPVDLGDNTNDGSLIAYPASRNQP
jgi:hypothetical protein